MMLLDLNSLYILLDSFQTLDYPLVRSIMDFVMELLQFLYLEVVSALWKKDLIRQME